MRIVLALLATLALAAPASAQERICRGQWAPPTPAQAEEAQLKRFAEQRASFGFRHDLPYIRELIRRGVWEYDVGYIPVTRAENKYLKLRDELELGAAANRYLNRLKGVEAGGAIEDDWPRKPFIRLFFKRDVAKHLAAVKRLARDPELVRAQRVHYSWADLDRAQERIGDDRAKLRKLGFEVVTTALDPSANRVDASVRTARTDVARYFRRHYGPVRARSIGANKTFTTCVSSSYFEFGADGRNLVLHWESGGGRTPKTVEVVEFADRVEVGAVEDWVNGPSTDEGLHGQLPFTLSAPLGERPLIDAATGQRLVQRGPSPGEPPCTPPQDIPDPPTGQDVHRFEMRAYQYLRRQAATYGGFRVDGRQIVVGFTRDAGRHLAPLKRRVKGVSLRVETVAHTEVELRALAERISSDAEAGSGFFDGYGDAGFALRSSRAQGQTVIVTLITPRADHQAYFTARYGPTVQTQVIGDRFECA